MQRPIRDDANQCTATGLPFRSRCDDAHAAPPADAPPADVDPAPPVADTAALQAQVAALQAEQTKTAGVHAAPPADAPPADVDPAPPVADTAAMEALQAQVAALQAEQTKTAGVQEAQSAAMRAQVLGQLGVMGKYRKFAPADANPFTEAGRAALEKWAQENRELCEVRDTTPPAPILKGFDKEPNFMGAASEAQVRSGLAQIDAQFEGKGWMLP